MKPPAMRIASSVLSRLRGLIGRKREWLGTGVLLLVPCHGIHSFGMRRQIDVAFIDASGTVLRAVEHLPPCRAVSCPGAAAVVERFSPDGGSAQKPWPKAGERLALCGKNPLF